jgi:protein-S-isoprenylcysteine O-methyltransferase Ste14
MKASQIEFRLRVAIMVAVVALGFWSPWIEAWGIGRRISLLEWFALELSRLGLFPFTIATPVAIVLASLLAAAGVVLRVWSTAWLGRGVVNNAEMKAGAVMADGPYRFVRNPLYLGTWFMMAAMSFIMPATGALFAMVLITLFLLRLILAEEAFLAARLGEPYQAYLRAVPRLFPRLRSNLPRAGLEPRWGQSLLSEINPIGVLFTVAVLSWSYNNRLMVRAILVSFGLSLVVRALMPGKQRGEDKPS